MPLATKKQIFYELWNHGFFSGFEKILRVYNPDTGESGNFKRFLYEKLLKEVLEAKKEAARLQQTLSRMEVKCRQGMSSPGNPRVGWDANASSLQADVRAVDGWTVSLFESDITLLHYIISLQTAHNRSNTLHTSMKTVMDKRMSELKLFESQQAAFKLKLI